jgi:hypothetical protein
MKLNNIKNVEKAAESAKYDVLVRVSVRNWSFMEVTSPGNEVGHKG